MRVLHTIAGMSTRSGGPSTCTKDLLDGINNIQDINADLLTVSEPIAGLQNVGYGREWLKEVPCDYHTPLCLSSNIRRTLELSDYDIYHSNALWMYINHITCKIAREKKKPYVLSPHGMLYPTALRIKRWKKWPMLKLWFQSDIMKATCIHATCREEMEHVRAFGYNGPIAVIPNPVVIPQGIECKTTIPSRRVIGFLGRINSIKKIENLLYAAAIVEEKGLGDFEVDIIGKGDNEYEEFLKNEAKRLGIADRVNFVGFLIGKQKYKALSEVRTLFVPSEQENFGMIVPEALICGTPVYASLGTPWIQLNEYNCGWWKDNTPETIARVIEEVLAKTDEDLLQMGERGRQLVIQNYEQNKVANMMTDLYQWILGNADKPDFVYE